MKIEKSVLDELNKKIDELDGMTTFSVMNRLKELYGKIIDKGHTEEDFLNLASYILYAGYCVEE